MVISVMTPYSTVKPLFGTALPSWVPDELDKERIASYQVYEQIYWMVTDTFKLTFRGQEDRPLYLPTPRTIVDTANRYVGAHPGFAVTPRLGSEQTADTLPAQQAFTDLFARERFFSKYIGNKRYGLIRGDWCWHVVADPAKPAGSRISIHSVDPAAYFPITHPDNVDQIIGCHIVETITQGNDTLIRRQTYRKVLDGTGKVLPGGGITNEEALFKTDDWGGPESKPAKIIRPPTPLPKQITALPVYHVKNGDEPQNPFGSSEMRGFEMLLSSINQTITDEDLSLALDGIGLYVTNLPRPTDDDGNQTDWVIGPGRIIETDGIPQAEGFFNRVGGVGDLKPYGDHIDRVTNSLYEAAGIPDLARGNVDVAVAESGIALLLKMAPILSKAEDAEIMVKEIHDQMFYDLANGWFPAYEAMQFGEITVSPTFGDKLPVNRAAKFQELNDMLSQGVISVEFYRTEATKLGYVFPPGMANEIAAAQAALAAQNDPFGSRLDGTLQDPTLQDPSLNGAGA